MIERVSKFFFLIILFRFLYSMSGKGKGQNGRLLKHMKCFSYQFFLLGRLNGCCGFYEL
jgi:hypothetical protein